MSENTDILRERVEKVEAENSQLKSKLSLLWLTYIGCKRLGKRYSADDVLDVIHNLDAAPPQAIRCVIHEVSASDEAPGNWDLKAITEEKDRPSFLPGEVLIIEIPKNSVCKKEEDNG